MARFPDLVGTWETPALELTVNTLELTQTFIQPIWGNNFIDSWCMETKPIPFSSL